MNKARSGQVKKEVEKKKKSTGRGYSYEELKGNSQPLGLACFAGRFFCMS